MFHQRLRRLALLGGATVAASMVAAWTYWQSRFELLQAQVTVEDVGYSHAIPNSLDWHPCYRLQENVVPISNATLLQARASHQGRSAVDWRAAQIRGPDRPLGRVSSWLRLKSASPDCPDMETVATRHSDKQLNAARCSNFRIDTAAAEIRENSAVEVQVVGTKVGPDGTKADCFPDGDFFLIWASQLDISIDITSDVGTPSAGVPPLCNGLAAVGVHKGKACATVFLGMVDGKDPNSRAKATEWCNLVGCGRPVAPLAHSDGKPSGSALGWQLPERRGNFGDWPIKRRPGRARGPTHGIRLLGGGDDEPAHDDSVSFFASYSGCVNTPGDCVRMPNPGPLSMDSGTDRTEWEKRKRVFEDRQHIAAHTSFGKPLGDGASGRFSVWLSKPGKYYIHGQHLLDRDSCTIITRASHYNHFFGPVSGTLEVHTSLSDLARDRQTAHGKRDSISCPQCTAPSHRAADSLVRWEDTEIPALRITASSVDQPLRTACSLEQMHESSVDGTYVHATHEWQPATCDLPPPACAFERQLPQCAAEIVKIPSGANIVLIGDSTTARAVEVIRKALHCRIEKTGRSQLNTERAYTAGGATRTGLGHMSTCARQIRVWYHLFVSASRTGYSKARGLDQLNFSYLDGFKVDLVIATMVSLLHILLVAIPGEFCLLVRCHLVWCVYDKH